MKNMTLANIALACNGKLFLHKGVESNTEITGVQLDSRKLEPGNLFIATVGERVDGHSFIPKAFDMGAVCAVCEREPEDADRYSYILVKDSFVALKDIARFYRSQLDIPVVGITGSVGKTSTKEAIAAVLGAKYEVLKTAGNFNNEVGLPLTILSIRDYHQVAVVEMGISDFGEMDRLSEIAKPDVCVITNIGICHLENLKTQQGILRAKTEMFNHRNPNGEIILNGDDPFLSTIKEVDGTVPKRFGYGAGNNVCIREEEMFGLLGSDFTFETGNGRTLKCHSSLPGKHVITNAACAALVGHVLGLSDGEIKQGIVSQQPMSGRSNIINTAKYLVVDDCYNANPVSMKEAIDLLSLSDSRKVLVLGDMFELGSDENRLHYEVGSYAGQSDADVILTAGALSQYIHDGAIATANDKKQIKHYETRDMLIADLDNIIKKGDSILIKASHGMHFEKIVNELTEIYNSF